MTYGCVFHFALILFNSDSKHSPSLRIYNNSDADMCIGVPVLDTAAEVPRVPRVTAVRWGAADIAERARATELRFGSATFVV